MHCSPFVMVILIYNNNYLGKVVVHTFSVHLMRQHNLSHREQAMDWYNFLNVFDILPRTIQNTLCMATRWIDRHQLNDKEMQRKRNNKCFGIVCGKICLFTIGTRKCVRCKLLSTATFIASSVVITAPYHHFSDRSLRMISTVLK